ncbi:DUF2905 domain-containing protein [Tissierella sp. MSJ-40]|uniref:DUF2905 domain-containing protein n=1 Tax=Tissierella simiarum TaxID=2841534 RepID=A0ABS6EBS2_9FIRM|nr:DUF2905 domain-containing protein [Tissierella simiarum]MBU5439659.1 DUF2905 domain-containing protein [Tissierella simiarum]
MDSFGKILISIGILLVIVGGIMVVGNRFGLGKLPGDIFIQKGNFTFFFPLASSIIISLILTLLLKLFRR